MNVFGRRQGGGRRLAAREAAPLIVVFTTVTRSRRATLIDVSATGARLSGSDSPKPGEELMISVDAVRAYGHVVWCEGGEFGLEFDPPLEEEDLQLLREKGARTAGFGPELRHALDTWTAGTAR